MTTPTRTVAPPSAPVSSAPGSSAVLALHDVVKEYPGEPPVRALDGVTLTVARGELCAIVGPSGSGKSTLLHIVGALDRPTTGTVRIDRRDVGALNDRQLSGLRAHSIGFVFQRFHLIEGVSALDNVADGLLYRGVPLTERRARARVALDRVGLSSRLGHRPSQLSGGEQQRVAIARAIVGDPAIVLADEPTGNLDSHTGHEIIDIFRSLHAAGSTIAIITHDTALADTLPRQVHLRDGRLERDDTSGTWS